MNQRTLVAFIFGVLVLAFEVPKLPAAIAQLKGGDYWTPSVKKYHLQTPPSPRGWILIHMLTALPNLGLLLSLYLSPNEKRARYFRGTHFAFVLSVGLQLGKLGRLSLFPAVMVNSSLLGALEVSRRCKRYDVYLGIMTVPVMLSTFASIV